MAEQEVALVTVASRGIGRATAEALAAQGVETLVEAGPGKVLAGLNKRIVKEQVLYPVLDAESLAAALAAITHE